METLRVGNGPEAAPFVSHGAHMEFARDQGIQSVSEERARRTPDAAGLRRSAGENQTRMRLRALVGGLSKLDSGVLDGGVPFTQMGFDSLLLTQISFAVERDFGVRVAFRQLLEELPTIDSLAAHIDLKTAPAMAQVAAGNGTIPVPANTAVLDSVTVVPLTESQREIWFASQLSKAASCVYNQCYLLHLRGSLQAGALEVALKRLLERHEALRTSFLPGGKEQCIGRRSTVPLRFDDWSGLKGVERAQRLDAAQQEEARVPFDLVAGPVLRVRLLRMNKSHHVFIVTIHHLACDGYSFGILLRELGELYCAECRDVPGNLPPALQFSEYARFQAQREQSPAHAEDAKYWIDQFAAGAPVLKLPTDYPRSRAWKFEGAREWRALPQTLGEDLKQLSAQHGCTLFTTMFAAYALFLRRLSGQKDIIVGVPFADRRVAGGETLVGHCVNFLPLRATVEDDRTFTEHLEVMQKVFLNANEHGRYAFGSLIQRLNLSRQPGRWPIVSATFTLEQLREPVHFVSLETGLAGNAHSAAAFDIDFDVTNAPDGVQLACWYNSSLFAHGTIQRWLGHFQTLLEGIVAAPQRKLCELALLTEGEQRKLLVEANRIRADYPRDQCVHEIFEHQAARRPWAVAVDFEGAELSYRELNERANRLAHYLLKHGVERESVVAVCLERSLEMVVALLGILKAGAAYMSLDMSHPKERLAFMLQEAAVPVVLTQEKWRGLFPTPGEGNGNTPASSDEHSSVIPGKSKSRLPLVVCLDSSSEELAREPVQNPLCPATAENLAYVSFTSGSTGRPKGVCIPHRGVVRLVKNPNYASLTADEIFLQLAPLAFDASTFEIWGALLNGARLVVFPAHSPSLTELGGFIAKKGITTLWLTAGLFHQMIEHQAGALRGVRQLLAGGDVLSVTRVRQALEQLPGTRLINGYGPTENTTFTCCHPITAADTRRHAIPIGRPIAGTQVYVLDEALQPAPIGVPGELCAGGDGLARGYLNETGMTTEKFIPNPLSNNPASRLYKTGDLVRWLPDGNLEFLGRLDHQVKLRGFRVETGEIESVLKQHPAVRECVVAAQEESSGEKRLIAFLVAGEVPPPTHQELQEYLQRWLPDYMIPCVFVPLNELPLAASGKVDRAALLAAAGRLRESRTRFVETGDEVEKQLAGIWQTVLGRTPVGANDDFFELGGHSLLALQLVARVEEAFEKQIPVGAVFQARTVAQMAQLLRETNKPSLGPDLVEIQPKGTRPPLILVHGVGGGMFWGYSTLSHHLGTDQPVYAFKAHGADKPDESAGIEEMATHFVAELRAFQPQGPYYLGGYCFGGNVAYEMARQLDAQGQTVALLALINSMPPNSGYSRIHFSPAFCLKFLKNLGYWSHYVLQLKSKHRWDFLRWKLRAMKRKLSRGVSSGIAALNLNIEDFADLSSLPEGQRRLWKAHIHALFRHHPGPYAGHVTLFRTRGHTLLCSFDEAFGWRELASGGVTIRIISGAHETIMNEPHVRLLAKELQQFLNTPRSNRPGEAPAIPAVPKTPSLPVPGVQQLFEAQAARTPDATAVAFRNQRWSFRELNACADELAGYLRSLGAGPDVPIGICVERSLKMTAGVLGILKAGGAYVPLDPAYPKERLKLMIENSRVSLLLTQTSLRDMLPSEIPGLHLVFIDVAYPKVSVPVRQRRPVADPLAYVIHTSGSTGVPKGVAMSHRPLMNLITWQLQNSKVGAGARTLQFASLSFDASFHEMFSTWGAGGALVLIDEQLRRDPTALLRLVAEEKIERLFLPFVALEQLAEAFGERPLPLELREIITAGEQLQITPKIVNLFESLPACTLHNHYGPTESHVVTTFTLSGAPRQWPPLPPIGRPIANTRIHLLDEKRQPVAAGDAGEIYIGGDCLARGYLYRADLTAERFVPDPFTNDPAAKLYKTGDLGRFGPDGNIEFLGRIDHQVKIRGFRVELGEVEAALRQNPKLREAIVVARADQRGNKRLVAYYISRQEQSVTGDELRRFLGATLPDYMVPSIFVSLTSLPLTPNGKVDRRNLPEPPAEQAISGEHLPPRTPMEESLAGIWREVLGSRRIGVHDNFFDLGGHSLLAVQVVSRIRHMFQVEVPVAGLFGAPTIALLAEGLASARWGRAADKSDAIPRANRDEALPLSYPQQRVWFIQQLESNDFACHIPAAMELEGALDVNVMAACLNEVVRRHEILRTTFVERDGRPVQLISRESTLRLPVIELTKHPEIDSRMECWIANEAERPFDLERGPLVRCALLRLAPQKHVLLVILHHLIADCWSLGVFFHELAALYESNNRQRPTALGPLPIQYADYAVWQRGKSQQLIHEEHVAYWKTRLAAAPPSTPLPADHVSSDHHSFRGARVSVALPGELTASLQQLNRREASTPFMTLFAALMILLHKWTRAKDLVVGTVSAGRSRQELEHLIGCFRDFLPIRLKLSGNEKGAEVLAAVKSAVLEAYAHLECPFERIVRAIRPECQGSGNRSYNVGFLMQNFPQIVLDTQQLRGKLLPFNTDSVLLDLNFTATENGPSLSLACEYRTGLFERRSMEELLASFVRVLETLAHKPDTNLSEFVLTSALEEQSRKNRRPSKTMAERLAYWNKKLSDAPPLMELPVDHRHPAISTNQSGSENFALDENLAGKIKVLGQNEGCTLPIVLLSAFQALVSHYTGRDDIVLGSTISTRNPAGHARDSSGSPENMLVLRTDLSADPTFRQLLVGTRDAVQLAQEHEISFDKLLAALQAPRESSHHPLFQIAFNFQNASSLEAVPSGLELALTMMKTGSGLAGCFNYSSDLFEPATIQRMRARWVVLLEGAVTNPDCRLSELPWLTADERRQVLVEWNDTTREYPPATSLTQLFEAQVERTPDLVALVCEGMSLTYRELNCRANQLAHHLRNLGVGPEVLVGLCLERSERMLVGILGILKAGGAYVPLDPAYPKERLAFMLDDARAPVLVTEKHLLALFSDASDASAHRAVVRLDAHWDDIERCNPENPRTQTIPENLAYVIYTSGSTGQPKGVAIEHRSAVALMHWAREVFSRDEIAGVLGATSMCFDLSIFEMFVPLSWGGTLILAQNALALGALPAADKVTLLNTVPSVMRELLRVNGVPRSVRVVNLAGEPLETSLVDQIYSKTSVAKVYDLYGPSETTTYSTSALRKPGEAATIGRPLPNEQVYLLDRRQQPVPVGMPGELYIGGSGLARGYLRQPELTAEKFIAHPFRNGLPPQRLYRTGDLARYRLDGTIELLGRMDHQVKIRGFRIELGEIETVLHRHPKLFEVIVLAREDEPDDKRLVAYFVSQSAQSVTANELRTFLKEKLPEYMIPSAFVSLKALPLTANGKVDRKRLPAPIRARLELNGEYAAPTPAVAGANGHSRQPWIVREAGNTNKTKHLIETKPVCTDPHPALEQQLCGIWEKVLRVNRVGIHDNFFEMGGHSLLATQVIALVEKLTRKKLPVVTMFQAPTIEQLAKVISETKSCSAHPNLVPIQPQGAHPPLFLVHGAGGDVLWGYANLAHCLKTDQPVYGIQTNAMDAAEEFSTLQQMAAHYVVQARAFQPAGPYFLGGYCFGGNLACEMARQIQTQGETVALLALIDCAPSNRGYEKLQWRPRLAMDFARNLMVWFDDFLHLKPREKRSLILRKVRTLPRKGWERLRGRHSSEDFDLEEFIDTTHVSERERRLWKNHLRLLLRHVSEPYLGHITLFRTRGHPLLCSFENDFGWGRLATKVTVRKIPGSHEGIFVEPHVRFLAGALEEALRSSRNESSKPNPATTSP